MIWLAGWINRKMNLYIAPDPVEMFIDAIDREWRCPAAFGCVYIIRRKENGPKFRERGTEAYSYGECGVFILAVFLVEYSAKEKTNGKRSSEIP